MNRLNGFMHEHFRKYGCQGYFLKCDMRKFFDNIDHEILKERLRRIVDDKGTLHMLFDIIDSYEVALGKGIPMGNQTSQWFALFYLDPLDRLVKEKLRIKYYTFNKGKETVLDFTNTEGTITLNEGNVLRVEYTPIIMTKGGGFTFD